MSKTDTTDLNTLAQNMADAIEAHRKVRGTTNVGQDARTQYNLACLESDLAIDAAERSYREAMQQTWRQSP